MKPTLRTRVRPSRVALLATFLAAVAVPPFSAQSPSGPITPQPGAAIQQAPPGPKIGVRVALVNTPVTVRDAKGQMVDNLDAKDFRITDNGVAQRITHFDLGGDALSLVILVETSSRIAPMFPQVRKAGIVLTEAVMAANGEAAVIGFNDSVDKLQDFTSNHDKIQNAFDKLQQGTSGSKLYDAMAVGVEMLSGRPLPTADVPGRRRIMLILSEATDSGSDTRFGAALRQAQLSNVTIYSVGLSTTRAELQAEPKDNTPHPTPPGTFGLPPQPGTVQTPETENARYGSGNLMDAVVWAVQHVKDKMTGNPLELATAGTGGAHLATFKDRSLEKAIDEIGGELHSQYSVSYTPTGTNDAGYHEIKVTVAKNGLRVRARPGYYVAPPES
jgi:VWFA-related protein